VQVILGTKNSARKTREVSFGVLVTVAQKVCVCVCVYALGVKKEKRPHARSIRPHGIHYCATARQETSTERTTDERAAAAAAAN
jgi:hypothetical protein